MADGLINGFISCCCRGHSTVLPRVFHVGLYLSDVVLVHTKFFHLRYLAVGFGFRPSLNFESVAANSWHCLDVGLLWKSEKQWHPLLTAVQEPWLSAVVDR